MYIEDTNPMDVPVNEGNPYQVSVEGSRYPATTPPIAIDSWDSGNTGDYTGIGGNSTGSSWAMPDFLSGIGDWWNGIDWNNPLGGDPMMWDRLGAAGTALNSFYNADQYDDLAGKYAEQMNPFGAYRGRYADLLGQSYDDPTAFLNDPAHKAIQERQLNILQGRNRATGFMGSGKDITDMTDYLAKSDAEYLAQERQRLGELAGAGIGPSAAADLIKTGVTGATSQRSNALAALAAMLAPRPQNNQGGIGSPITINNNNNSSGGAGGGGYTDYSRNNPATLDWLRQSGGGFTPDLTSNYWKQFLPQNLNIGTGTGTDSGLANQELNVDMGNYLPNSPYDSYGGVNPNYGNVGGGYEGGGTYGDYETWANDASSFSDSNWNDFFTNLDSVDWGLDPYTDLNAFF